MKTGKARIEDCLAIAELAQLAGHGIPGYFWTEWQQPGDSIVEAGARKAACETTDFSYRNARLAWIDEKVAGMLMAYRMSAAGSENEDPADFPEFVQPMIELELLVPDSFYINMLATFPQFRGNGVGTALMGLVDELAHALGCNLVSMEVFDSNPGALRLYQRLGYEIIAQRDMIASAYLPAGQVLLLTKPVDG